MNIDLGSRIRVKEKYYEKFNSPLLNGYEFLVEEFELNEKEVVLRIAQKHDDKCIVAGLIVPISELYEVFEAIN